MSTPSPPRTSVAVKGDVTVVDAYDDVAGARVEVDLHDVWAEAWDRFTAHAGVLIVSYFVLALITTVLTFPLQMIMNELSFEVAQRTGDLGLLSIYLSTMGAYVVEAALFDPWLTNGGMIAMALVIARGEPVRFSTGFTQLRRLFPLLLTGFGAALFAALGGMLLVVPGLLLMYLFSFALILVLDQGEGPLEALRGSAKVIWAHRRSMALPLLGCAGLFVAGKLTCGFGMLAAGPLIALVHVGLYERAFVPSGADRHNH